MKKGKAQKDILYIAISSFVLVMLWIGFSLYHVHATSTITPELQAQIEEISPNFDAATIQELKGREKASPVYELSGENASPATTLAPTPVTQNAPVASLPAAIQPPAGFVDGPEQ